MSVPNRKRIWRFIGYTVLAILLSSSVGTPQTTPTLEVTPSSLSFGNVSVGQCSATQNFTVRNSGGGTLTGAATTSEPFRITAGGSFSLGANQTSQASVQFCPTSAGSFSGVVSFTSNGGNLTRPTSGTGTATFTLTVTKSGGGVGTVTSTPVGINCGPTCSASFTSGTSVTLTATPAPGSDFSGWSGACSGTTRTCTLIITSNQTVTAIFSISGPLGYTGNVEGASQDDLFQPAAAANSVAIRGDGDRNFANGPNACPSIIGCGNDKILGTSGDDTIFGDDSLGGVSNSGHDWILADDGDDIILGEAGNDQIFGGMGNDLIDGGKGNDLIEGGDEDDTISGGSGSDILRGGDGDDVIDGGLGNDIIEGGLGTDTLSGGGGNDIFILKPGDAGDSVETIFCTKNEGETGRVFLRGSKFKRPFGRYRNTTKLFSDPKSDGMFEIITGPGICVIRRG